MGEYKPTIKKPEGVCFWCKNEMDKKKGYYEPCPKCESNMTRDEDHVFVYAEVEFPILIDQPSIEHWYPTGNWFIIERDTLIAILEEIFNNDDIYLEPEVCSEYIEVCKAADSIGMTVPLFNEFLKQLSEGEDE